MLVEEPLGKPFLPVTQVVKLTEALLLFVCPGTLNQCLATLVLGKNFLVLALCQQQEHWAFTQLPAVELQCSCTEQGSCP